MDLLGDCDACDTEGKRENKSNLMSMEAGCQTERSALLHRTRGFKMIGGHERQISRRIGN